MERNRNSYLPLDLVNEILLRLPVKALLQCKCVCKEWCGLIKSPSFVKQHFSHESNQDCLLFRLYDAYAMYKDDESHSLVEVSNHLPQMPTNGRDTQLMGPENGVFCVVNNRNCIGLLNPAIRKFRTLPPHPLHDPYRFRSVIGFGLDPSSGDFKVVAFERSHYNSFAFVYNLSSDSWKIIEAVEALDLFAFGDYIYSSNHLILNGVIHWIIKFDNRDVSSILAFDMRSDKFQEISIPDALRNREMDLGITKYGDSIAVMSFKHGQRVDLLVMGRDGLWSKKFMVCRGRAGYMGSLCVWKKNMVYFHSSSSPLTMCDISRKKAMAFTPETGPEYVYNHFIYKESLVSIKGERADCILDFYNQI